MVAAEEIVLYEDERGGIVLFDPLPPTMVGIVFWKPTEDVRIFDTTLRDGEQSPGTSFSLEDKKRIADALDELGVDVIEAGFPINSEHEFEAVSEIAEGVETDVCGLARVEKPDIDAAVDAEVDVVHVFVSTSDIQIEKSMRSTREEVLDMAVESVEYAKDHGVECVFSPMDATRTDFDFLVEIVRESKNAGADIVNIPDTVGVMDPQGMYELVDSLDAEVGIPYDVHCHDDFGLATANTLAGVRAGAVQAQVTVNGIGERAGNAALEEVVMALESVYGVDTSVDTTKIYEASKLVEEASRISLPGNKPVVGENAFSHESGIHAAGVINDSSTFEPGIMTPEMVGHERRLVVGKHTGRHNVREKLREAGYDPTEEEVTDVTRRVKERGGRGEEVAYTDFLEIAEGVMSGNKARRISDGGPGTRYYESFTEPRGMNHNFRMEETDDE